MSLVIYAPSASGKSTFQACACGPRGIPVVDGDNVISAHDAWPKAPEWWKDPVQADPAILRHCEIMRDLLRRNRDVVVVNNAKVNRMVPFLADSVPTVRQVAVLIPLEEYLRRAFHRSHLARTEGKEAAGGHAPRDPEDHLREWLKAREDYRALRLRTFSSFQEAAKVLGLYVNSRRYAALSPPPALPLQWQTRVDQLTGKRDA